VQLTQSAYFGILKIPIEMDGALERASTQSITSKHLQPVRRAAKR